MGTESHLMSTLQANGIDIHHETAGEGPPLVLLTGLGFASWGWFRQIPTLSRHFTTIAIDNRGAGRSSKPDEPYSIAMMAEDAAAVLRHLGVRGANVLGLSMGGYIAQELALSHRELVARLILCSTAAGGEDAVIGTPETFAIMRREAEAGWGDEVMQESLTLRFSDRCIASKSELLAEYAELRKNNRPPRHAWAHQLQACFEFAAGPRLAGLDIPTLVITGDDDPIVPSANGRILADKIPGAELFEIPTGRHLAVIEFADQVNQRVIEFCTG